MDKGLEGKLNQVKIGEIILLSDLQQQQIVGFVCEYNRRTVKLSLENPLNTAKATNFRVSYFPFNRIKINSDYDLAHFERSNILNNPRKRYLSVSEPMSSFRAKQGDIILLESQKFSIVGFLKQQNKTQITLSYEDPFNILGVDRTVNLFRFNVRNQSYDRDQFKEYKVLKPYYNGVDVLLKRTIS